MSHAVGVGEPFPREIVRAMLLLRANTLALGHSGCRPVVVDLLLAFLEHGLHPVVPAQGSVGASGDLAPLAHLALPLIGRGQVELGGQVLPALLALREAGVEPLRLEAKEGLALLNGTQMMSAIGALLLADADASCDGKCRCRHERGGPARYRRRLCRRTSWHDRTPDRWRWPGSCATSSAHRRCRRATTPRSTRSRTPTRSVACRRSTGRCAMRSTTSGGCWTSSSTRPRTTRSSSRAAGWPRRIPLPPAAAG